MRCLKVKQPFANQIVQGLKVWELRTRPTYIRERIAIGSEGLVVGYVDIADCWCMSKEALKKHEEAHLAGKFIDGYAPAKTHLFVWYLQHFEVEKHPFPYSFSTGSWCNCVDEIKKVQP